MNYLNGAAKNGVTGQCFKAAVRILKRLRYKLIEEGSAVASRIPPYLVECLVWNVPNEGFQHETRTDDIRYVLAHLRNETRAYEACKEWGEVNELKYLFRTAQPWMLTDAHNFLQAAWYYFGFR
jgi:hypothetical protein